MSGHLQNIRVLVTRPINQSEELSLLIEQAGGDAVCLPMLEIEAAVDAESAQRCKFIAGYDWVIFISQNAVRYALSLLPTTEWPDKTAIAAIGRSTTKALRQAGFPVEQQPDENMNSEGLLQALSSTPLDGKKILIIRGVGGREKLATGLRERQAQVDYAEVYRRICPSVEATQLDKIASDMINVITVASGETLRNLIATLASSTLTEKQKQQFISLPMIVVSERIKNIAKKTGYLGTVIVADEPSNAGIVNATQQWRSGDSE